MQFKPHRPKYLSATHVSQDELNIFHRVSLSQAEPTPTDFQNEGLDAPTLKAIRLAYRMKYPKTKFSPWLREDYRLDTSAKEINELLAKTQNDAFFWTYDEGYIVIDTREYRDGYVIDTDLYITTLDGETARLHRVKRRAKHASSGRDDKVIETTPLNGICVSGTVRAIGEDLGFSELTALLQKELKKITKSCNLGCVRYYFGRSGGSHVFEPTETTVMQAVRALPWWPDLPTDYEDLTPSKPTMKKYLVDSIQGDRVTLVDFPTLSNTVTASLRSNLRIAPASIVEGYVSDGYLYEHRIDG